LKSKTTIELKILHGKNTVKMDIKWEHIKDFAKESDENIKNFVEAVKGFIAHPDDSSCF